MLPVDGLSLLTLACSRVVLLPRLALCTLAERTPLIEARRPELTWSDRRFCATKVTYDLLDPSERSDPVKSPSHHSGIRAGPDPPFGRDRLLSGPI